MKPENYPEEIVKVFVLIQKASAMSRKTEPALWVFLDQADRASVKKGEVDSPGVLLDYPECCLAARRLRIKMMSEAYLDGLVKAVGLDSKAIAKAVVKNEKVEIDCPWLDAAVASDTKSRGRFPFVLHHACSNCLESANSPSARLNDVYEEIALKISPELHERLRDSDATSQSCDEHS